MHITHQYLCWTGLGVVASQLAACLSGPNPDAKGPVQSVPTEADRFAQRNPSPRRLLRSVCCSTHPPTLTIGPARTQDTKTSLNMAGTILITGANGSMAVHTVRYLLRSAPEYTLLLTVRDASDGDQNTKALRDVIADRSQQTQVSIRQLDHSHLDSVHKFAQDVSKEIADGRLPRLASIVCNAYYWNLSRPLEKTDDGFEKTMQVTHLAR